MLRRYECHRRASKRCLLRRAAADREFPRPTTMSAAGRETGRCRHYYTLTLYLYLSPDVIFFSRRQPLASPCSPFARRMRAEAQRIALPRRLPRRHASRHSRRMAYFGGILPGATALYRPRRSAFRRLPARMLDRALAEKPAQAVTDAHEEAR